MTDEQDPPRRRGPGRPATGQTPVRRLRYGGRWDEAARVAASRGETMTDVVRRILDRELPLYIAGR